MRQNDFTLDDIIEQLADDVGVWGASEEHSGYGCRVCWTVDLRRRILEAVAFEKGQKHALKDYERRLWDEVAMRIFARLWTNVDDALSAAMAYSAATALILERRRRLS